MFMISKFTKKKLITRYLKIYFRYRLIFGFGAWVHMPSIIYNIMLLSTTIASKDHFLILCLAKSWS